MVLFTSRSLLTWGKSPGASPDISPQVFAYCPLLTINSLHLYRKYMMTEYALFVNTAERCRKDMAPLWGNFNVCPHLDHPELPCHSLVEMFSVSSLKVWGNIQEPHHNIAYILVHSGNTTEDRHYGISLVWVNPQPSQDFHHGGVS